jgi:hypothetical protein
MPLSGYYRTKRSQAMRHSNALGAGAKARKGLQGKEKIEVVMKEFERGTLHSGSGEIVKNRKQAIAIAMSEKIMYGCWCILLF